MQARLFLQTLGKCPGRQETLGSIPAGVSSASSLLYLKDSLSNRFFLVDTGAALSVYPHQSSEPCSSLNLVSADGSYIKSWGERLLPLKFGNRRFSFRFRLAAVDRPILGADFLAANSLLVDVARRQLLDYNTLEPLPATQTPVTSTLRAALLTVPGEFQSLLSEFPEVFGSSFNSGKQKHGVQHHIVTSGPPVFSKARRLDPEKLEIARQEFQAMEDAGIIRRSNSPWASPLHMVPKPNGSYRPCGDYRRLNLATTPDRYPVPNLQDYSAMLSGCTIFSKLDLTKAYYQVPMCPEDIPKTAIITPFGMFEFLVMPFGLRNAGQTFQRLMDKVLNGLPFTVVYLDDVLVASSDLHTHLQHMRLVLERFREAGLIINPEKCEFGKSTIQFLGHQITSSGATPLLKHVQAVQDYPTPLDRSQLQRYLGMVNFYRRFIPSAAKILLPLTNSLRGTPSLPFVWTPEMDRAFVLSKQALSSAALLVHPCSSATISLAVDASADHIGAVLQQFQSGVWAPLSFFSKKLSPSEVRYSTFDRELLAAFSAIRHFRFYLEGRKFQLWTDHKPLCSALSRLSPPWTSRQQRQLSFIAEFTSDLRYVPGPQNIVADAMSRPFSASLEVSSTTDTTATTVSSSTETENLKCSSSDIPVNPLLPCPPPGVDFVQMAALQSTCPSIKTLSAYPSLNIKQFLIHGQQLLCDVSTGTPRPLVPVALRHDVFSAIHGVAHLGTRATRRLVSARFVWDGLSSDVKDWTRACLDCQRGKVLRHSKADIKKIPVPSRRFSHLHCDLVGPLPSSAGYNYIFTIIDRTTRWAEAVPLSSISASDCASALFSSWISRFGVPQIITSDRGTQFVSSLWSCLCSLLGIQHSPTTAFHPQSNGMVERYHRRLKDSLRSRLASSDWYHHLPWVMLGLRIAPREDSSVSSAELVYGSTLAVPGEFLDSREELPPEVFLRRIRSLLSQQSLPPLHNVPVAPSTVTPELLKSKLVFVRNDSHTPPLTPLYSGPYLVVQPGPKFFRLQIGTRQDTVSVDRLKPVFSTEDNILPALPPKRGRPPKSPVDTPPVYTKSPPTARRGRPPGRPPGPRTMEPRLLRRSPRILRCP